ncbi:hypothetical protein H0H92_008344 [Tricholoma furcatifolium]|nr:hypothetical protein H0H92_008344 [Tricholoma furcatifolium]
MPSYTSILTSAFLLCIPATVVRAAPLVDVSRRDSVASLILLGYPVENPCDTYQTMRELNEGCETQHYVFFSELFRNYCPNEEHEDSRILDIIGRSLRPRVHRRRSHRGDITSIYLPVDRTSPATSSTNIDSVNL